MAVGKGITPHPLSEVKQEATGSPAAGSEPRFIGTHR